MLNEAQKVELKNALDRKHRLAHGQAQSPTAGNAAPQGSSNKKPLPPVWSGQRLEVSEYEWLVDGLLRTNRRRPSLLAGRPESGKSSLAWMLAADVAAGRSFLGRKTKPCEVLYIHSEETPEECQDILDELGHDWDHDRKIHVVDVNDCGANRHDRLEALARLLTAYPGVQLVIIEMLDDFLQIADIKENTASRQAFEEFDRVVMEKFAKSVSFVMLHHLGKKETDLSGDAILGATVLQGRTDTKIFLKQASDDDPRRLLHVTVRRGGTAIPKTYLDFDPRTGRSTLGRTLADERKANSSKTADRIRGQIIEYFAHHPATTEESCLETIEGNHDTKRAKFKELRRTGILKQSGRGIKGDPFVFSPAPIPYEKKEAA